MKMIKGDYDWHKRRKPLFEFIAIFFYLGGGWLIASKLHKYFHWEWWLAILAGIILGYYIGESLVKLLEYLVRRKNPYYRKKLQNAS